MRMTTVGGVLAGSLLHLAGAGAGATPILTVDVDGQGGVATVESGAPFIVTFLASGIPPGSDGKGLFGFGFTASFDAAAFVAGLPVADAQWTTVPPPSSGPGFVGLTGNRLGETDGPDGDGIVLATATFTALQNGTFPLSLTHFLGVGDNLLFDGTVLDGAGSGFFDSGTITVVPEPATPALCLLAAGLAALSRIRVRLLEVDR